jgi:aspartyl protease family protein
VAENKTPKKIGVAMVIAAWVVFAALLTFVADRFLDARNNPNGMVRSESGAGREVVLKRNWQGHYVADGFINGVRVTFLVDTGATSIALSQSLADTLGLERLYPQTSITAAGPVDSFGTILDEVRLGDIAARELRATILPIDASDEVLLGMAFLKDLEFTQRGDTLILRSIP